MNMKNIFLALGAVVFIIVMMLGTQIFETNDAGFVQIKQAAGTGTMTVRTQPGMYLQAFADIHEYKKSDVYDFNDRGDLIGVRFGDAATADISGQIKYRLPAHEDKLLKIHEEFRSYEALEHDLIRQVVAAALKQTSTFFGAEEVYSTRRADFISLVNEQIKEGLFATTYTESIKKDEDGNNFVLRKVSVKKDKNGKPILSENSAFKFYGVELIQFVVNDVHFDAKTNDLIAKRKEADQEKVVAKAKAERAKQDAITAAEQGKADVAKAQAEALVIKRRAVIEAKKEREVAEQRALKAVEEKKAIIAKGQADAEAARLKVEAGLTPLDRARIDMQTAIGVAEKLAGVKFPENMIIVGGGNGATGGAVDPFTAVGLQSLHELSKDIAKGSK